MRNSLGSGLKVFCLFFIFIFISGSFYIFGRKIKDESKSLKELNMKIKQSWANKNLSTKPKNKVLIFLSKGGGGHVATAKTIESNIGDKCKVEKVNIFTTVLKKIDTLNWLTDGKFTGEDVYDFFLKRGNNFLASEFKNFGARTFRNSASKIERIIYDFLSKNKPDLVISVVPLINAPVFNATKSLNIPFLIVTNDLDTSNYLNGFSSTDYDKFLYTLAFPEKGMLKKISKVEIPETQLRTIGFPIRNHFFESKNVDKIKKDFDIPLDKKVIMLMLGSVGSNNTIRYVRRLYRLNLPIHVIVCAGKNQKMEKKLKDMKLNNNNFSMSVIGFTERISDLMAASDLLITKPGPNSVCEALQMKLPMLLDCTNRSLYWEKYNIEFVKSKGFGEEIRKFKHLENLLKNYLFNSQKLECIKKNISAYNKPVFRDNIIKVVNELIKV